MHLEEKKVPPDWNIPWGRGFRDVKFSVGCVEAEGLLHIHGGGGVSRSLLSTSLQKLLQGGPARTSPAPDTPVLWLLDDLLLGTRSSDFVPTGLLQHLTLRQVLMVS